MHGMGSSIPFQEARVAFRKTCPDVLARLLDDPLFLASDLHRRLSKLLIDGRRGVLLVLPPREILLGIVESVSGPGLVLRLGYRLCLLSGWVYLCL